MNKSFVLLSVIFLAGCAPGSTSESMPVSHSASAVSEHPVTQPPEYYPPIDSEYYRSMLNSEEDLVYNALLNGCNSFQDTIEFDPVSTEEYLKVSRLFTMDHPEFYWMGHDSKYYSNAQEGVYKIQFEMSGREQDTLEQINAVIDDFVSTVPETDAYNTVKLVYEYIINNTEYDPSSEENQDITSVLLNHRSVCAGYAKTFQYMMNRLDIPCITVVGDAAGRTTGSHAWNMVSINGVYYWVDVTWGDPITQDGSQIISYEYLCISDEKLNKDHVIDHSVHLAEHNISFYAEYPACPDQSLEYHRLRNEYFEHYSRDEITSFILSRIEENKEIIMQFSSPEEMKSAFNDLSDNQYIFEILSQTGNYISTVSFQYSEDSSTLQIIY